MNKRKYLLFFFSFLLFLSWSVYSTGWYEPGRLLVQGVAEQGVADIMVRWNSGEGYNEYESRKVLVNIPKDSDAPTQHVRIRALGKKHPASESSTVSIIKIIIDGEEFDLKSIRPRSIFHDRLAIQLTENEPVFEFSAAVKQHIRVVFANSYYFGKVAVEINGVSDVHDLFVDGLRYEERPYDYYLLQPDGSFDFELELPRYQIKELFLQNRNEDAPFSLSSISLLGTRESKVLGSDFNMSKGWVAFKNPNHFLKRYYDPVRFGFRLLFAFGTMCLIGSFISLVQRSGGITSFLFHKSRRFFWGLALVFGLVSSTVFLPFWPGVMSLDSLFIWRASGLPEVYGNSHPILNMIFYMYLRGIWNHPAVVPLTQIVLSSLLIASIFDRIRKRGVSGWYLAPFFLLLTCSLPILLYNTALWKDIPFALLVLAWGMYFALTYGVQEQEWNFSIRYWAVFVLAYICLGFFRHNGLVYLLVVPIIWGIISPFSLKRGILYSSLAMVVALGILWTMTQIKSIGGLDFLKTSVTQHAMFLKNKSLRSEVVRVGKGYFHVFDMDKEDAVSDKWHFYLGDRYAWDYMKKTDLADYYPFLPQATSFPELKKNLKKLYFTSYEKPWKYLIWNPVHMLIVIPLILIAFRWFPATALFSGFLLCGALPLLILNIFNWRYFYFFFLGLYFVFPLMLLDLQKRKGG